VFCIECDACERWYHWSCVNVKNTSNLDFFLFWM
jgi:hypothetical protein